MREAATKDSWKHEPFGETEEIAYSGEFPVWEFARLRLGLIPQAMEDRWFVYYADNTLLFHRSWTGLPIYRVTFSRKASVHVVAKAERAQRRDPDGNLVDIDLEYEAALLDFLISNLLLGQRKPFPLPAEMEGNAAVFQHHASGSGYPAQKP